MNERRRTTAVSCSTIIFEEVNFKCIIINKMKMHSYKRNVALHK